MNHECHIGCPCHEQGHAREIEKLQEEISVLRAQAGPQSKIQPTMIKTVTWLQSLGFNTTDSGDGVQNVQDGMEGALEFPHVFMVLPRFGQDPRDAADFLAFKCQERGIILGGDQAGETPCVELTYLPHDRVTILALVGVQDSNLPEYRQDKWAVWAQDGDL